MGSLLSVSKFFIANSIKIGTFVSILGAFLLQNVEPANAVCSNNENGAPGQAGEIEYFTSTNRLMYCDDTNWIAMGNPAPVSGGGSAAPTGCPNIGNTCNDGSVYVGLSPDGNIPMYMTTAAHQIFSTYGGFAQTGNPVCDDGGTNAACRTGAANTAALAALTPAQTIPRHCHNLVAHGNDDWYLPSRAEMFVLHQMEASVGSDLMNNEWYFTSSESSYNTDHVYTVNSASGQQWRQGYKGNTYPGRCVRKVAPPTGPSDCPYIGNVCRNGSVFAGISPDGNQQMFTTPADAPQTTWNNGSGTSLDSPLVNCTNGSQSSCATGAANTTLLAGLSNGHSPYRAAQYCENLIAHGATDWYLPADREFQVLADNHSAIGGFTSGGTVYYLDSSSEIGDTQVIGWTVNPYNGYVAQKSDTSRLRCVRKGAFTFDPIAHWRMDETSGTTISDSSGNGYNATLSNGSRTSGIDGNAISMNGTSSDYISLPDSLGSMILNNPFSISAWIYWRGENSDNDNFNSQHLIVFRRGAFVILYLREPDHPSIQNSVSLQLNGSTSLNIDSGANTLPTNEWVHIVATNDGITSKIFINGNEMASSNIGVSTSNQTYSNIIGRSGNASSENFNGIVDEVRLYNRAITLAEIETLANCTRSGNYYYNFSSNAMQWCESFNSAVNMGPTGGGSGGCSPVGALRYQTDRYQYCNGNGWIGIGK